MATNMFRNYIIQRIINRKISRKFSRINYCTKVTSLSNLQERDLKTNKNLSVLDICHEDISDYAPELAPTFNIAAYANKSFTIQQLIKLGVNLHKIEKKGHIELILKSDFERDIKKYIKFLNDVGVPASEYGNFLTINPLILKEDLDNLKVRINYLESKKFTTENIVRILSKNPKWISYSTLDIDDRLGFFQDQFNLLGDEVRFVTIRMPKLITHNLHHIETIKFTVAEEMGFNKTEIKSLLLQKPKIFTLNRITVQERLDFLLNTMNIPHSQLVEQPSAFLARLEKIKQRHNFLVLLKKNQYDGRQPGYISLEALVRGTDIEFCDKVVGTSVGTFNAYLKTL